MKTVFSKTQEVCDVWALQQQETARTGSNTSFRRDTLYSYGTPIARIVPSNDGMVALVSANRWSNSTSTVQGQARGSAAALGLAVFEVPSLKDGDASTASNLVFYEKSIDDVIGRIPGARAHNAATYRRNALALIGEATMFARAFGVAWSYRGDNPMGVPCKAERGQAA